MKALMFLLSSFLRCSGVGSEGRHLIGTEGAEGSEGNEGSGGNGESEVVITGSE